MQWGNTYRVTNGVISGGVDWQKQSIEAGTSGLKRGRHLDNTGLYLISQHNISSITLEGAIRGDDNSQFGWQNTWQAMAGWEFLSGYRLIAGYGTAFKAPNIGQLYSSYGNRHLKPEESRQWDLGLNNFPK